MRGSNPQVNSSVSLFGQRRPFLRPVLTPPVASSAAQVKSPDEVGGNGATRKSAKRGEHGEYPLFDRSEHGATLQKAGAASVGFCFSSQRIPLGLYRFAIEHSTRRRRRASVIDLCEHGDTFPVARISLLSFIYLGTTI